MTRRKRQNPDAAAQPSGPSAYEQRARDAHKAEVDAANEASRAEAEAFQNKPGVLAGKRAIVEFAEQWAQSMDLTITGMAEPSFFLDRSAYKWRYRVSFRAGNGGFSEGFVAMSWDAFPNKFTVYLSTSRSGNIAVHDAASLGYALQTRDSDSFIDDLMKW